MTSHNSLTRSARWDSASPEVVVTCCENGKGTRAGSIDRPDGGLTLLLATVPSAGARRLAARGRDGVLPVVRLK